LWAPESNPPPPKRCSWKSPQATTANARAERSRRHLPQQAAIARLVGAILLEQNDEWAVRRSHYLSLEIIGAIGDDPAVSLPILASLTSSA
jgi:hypothetical protein